jgi:hypothetical protein
VRWSRRSRTDNNRCPSGLEPVGDGTEWADSPRATWCPKRPPVECLVAGKLPGDRHRSLADTPVCPGGIDDHPGPQDNRRVVRISGGDPEGKRVALELGDRRQGGGCHRLGGRSVATVVGAACRPQRAGADQRCAAEEPAPGGRTFEHRWTFTRVHGAQFSTASQRSAPQRRAGKCFGGGRSLQSATRGRSHRARSYAPPARRATARRAGPSAS